MRRERFHHWSIDLILAALLMGSTTANAMASLGSLLHRNPAPAAEETAASDENTADDEMNEFLGLMRHDLTLNRAREKDRLATLPQTQQAPAQQSQPRIANAPGSTINLTPATVSITNDTSRSVLLRMPVVGVTRDEIENSWGDPRDGGRRRHRGIDIFAPKGTDVVAVTDGYISYIGDQPKGGHCLWLVSNDGMSFYYAHLDRWAPGLYEGMEVKSGDLLGFVGNTGNAAHTSSHLHFSVLDNDEAVNPFYVLKYGRTGGHVVLRGGLSAGGTR